MRARRVCLATVLSFSVIACDDGESAVTPPRPAVATIVDGAQVRSCDAACISGMASKGNKAKPANKAAPGKPKLNNKKPPEPPKPAVAAKANTANTDWVKGRVLSTTTTPGGVKVEDFVVGTGSTIKSGDTVDMHYTGWVAASGDKFDSSYDRGKTLGVMVGKGKVIKGWDEGLLGMKVGGKRRLTIPAAMAYGERAVGKIPANADLIFAVEAVSMQEPPADAKAFEVRPVRTFTTPEGINVSVYREGKGAALAEGQTASIHYTGKLDDGTVFDSSIPRGAPFAFPMGQGRVIKGWDIGAKGMKVGELRKLVIPAKLAYGDKARGKIPANSRLTFTMQLMKIG